jgi:hypothetical protein
VLAGGRFTRNPLYVILSMRALDLPNVSCPILSAIRSFSTRPISIAPGRLLWKVRWFLNDFDYDAELLTTRPASQVPGALRNSG